MSRKYEATIVIDAKGKDEGVDAIVGQITREFEKSGVKLGQIENLGKKKFPTAPRHVTGGFYVNLNFEAEPATVDGLKSKLKLNEYVYLQHYQRA